MDKQHSSQHNIQYSNKPLQPVKSIYLCIQNSSRITKQRTLMSTLIVWFGLKEIVLNTESINLIANPSVKQTKNYRFNFVLRSTRQKKFIYKFHTLFILEIIYISFEILQET